MINLPADAGIRAGQRLHLNGKAFAAGAGQWSAGFADGDSTGGHVQLRPHHPPQSARALEALAAMQPCTLRADGTVGAYSVSALRAGGVHCFTITAATAGDQVRIVRSVAGPAIGGPADSNPADRDAMKSQTRETRHQGGHIKPSGGATVATEAEPDATAEVDRRATARMKERPGLSRADAAMQIFREDAALQRRILVQANPGHRIAGGVTDRLDGSANPGVLEFNQRVAAEERAGLTHSQAITKVARADPVLHGRYLAGVNSGAALRSPSTEEKRAAEKPAAERFAARVKELERAGKLRSVAIRTASIESRADHEAWLQAQNPHVRLV